jgi:transcriptional regulator with XRE-family HTH domain
MTAPAIDTSRPATSLAGRRIAGGPRQAWTAVPGTSTRNRRFLTVNKRYGAEAIGPLLARLRQALGYSQLNLAQLLCAASGHPTITRVEISRWERQERIPSEFWLRPLAEVLAIPIDVLRQAVAVTRSGQHTDDCGEPEVTSWLTLHHGPKEIMIALGGVEVDQIRTVLSPARPLRLPDTATPMEVHE